jgi:hypothetical protein
MLHMVTSNCARNQVWPPGALRFTEENAQRESIVDANPAENSVSLSGPLQKNTIPNAGAGFKSATTDRARASYYDTGCRPGRASTAASARL